MTIPAFPLTWPPMFPRAKAREKGAFKTSLVGAIGNVKDSLRKFATDSDKQLTDLVISSNASLGDNDPEDPGVAVWFTWDGMQVVIAVDRYATLAANLQAIHLILEARRVELRHGTLALVRATFQGFLALAAPSSRSWRDVLGGITGTPSEQELKTRYRRAAADAHPDRCGGDSQAMAAVNAAYEQAKLELGFS